MRPALRTAVTLTKAISRIATGRHQKTISTVFERFNTGCIREEKCIVAVF